MLEHEFELAIPYFSVLIGVGVSQLSSLEPKKVN